MLHFDGAGHIIDIEIYNGYESCAPMGETCLFSGWDGTPGQKDLTVKKF